MAIELSLSVFGFEIFRFSLVVCKPEPEEEREQPLGFRCDD